MIDSGPVPVAVASVASADEAVVQWTAALDALEMELCRAGTELSQFTSGDDPAGDEPVGDEIAGDEIAGDDPGAAVATVAPVPPAPLPELPPLASLPPTAAALLAERAEAVLRRQGDLATELRAALSHLRRHLDLLDTIATPPARPRYVDQLS